MKNINDMIEEKRESIYEADNFTGTIKGDLVEPYKAWSSFKKLYKEAIKTREEQKCRECIDFYDKNKNIIEKIPYIDTKASKMRSEIASILKEYETKRVEQRWQNRKRTNVAEIKKQLMIIVRRYNNDPEVIAELKRLKAHKLVCHIFEENEYKNGNKEVVFEICTDDQEIRIKLHGIIYKLGEELENILDVSVSTGDGDEGCLYVIY